MQSELLKRIPKVDEMLAHKALLQAREALGHQAVLDAARALLAQYRQGILDGAVQALPDIDVLAMEAAALAMGQSRPSLRRVINATGIILHTNLGRAPLASSAVDAAMEAARGYSTLEYDVQSGGRGSRHSHVERLLTELTGAQAAMVVNNNAAAVLLALGAMAAGREAIVSRGEQVEIGGSFRIPEIMQLSGTILREVGTTNRTHPADYEAAIGPETGVLLKAHTSNYRIVGFTREVTLAELVQIGQAHCVPVLYDLGGGCLLPIEGSMDGEPCVLDCVKTGVDVLCFSGDKLLGGPQAGILLGKAEHIERLRKHPLARAIRVDKMTLAALEATLRLYRDAERASAEIPIQRMMRATPQMLREKAGRLLDALSLEDKAYAVETQSKLGGGTTPGLALASWAVSFHYDAQQLEAALRVWEVPIIARIAQDRLLLDVRTIEEADFAHIAQCLRDFGEKETDA